MYTYIIAVRPGAHRHPCSNIYMGTSPASEPETRAVQDELLTLNNIPSDVISASQPLGTTDAVFTTGK